MNRPVERTVEELIEVSEKFKLTEPQKHIIDKLKRGYRLRLINEHHMNGGTIVWVYNNNEQHAGHIYKALQHLKWNTLTEKITDLWK